ncbi:MAG TPA: polymer-forming cytoskeletal protein [Anaerolineales bacterium]|nr:polymer-forming cytoskeletal protein [Anaerolineales bacterium]
MRNIQKILSIFALVALVALAFVSPAYAFDGREGDKVVIKSDEVVNDDLYVTAQEFTLDGTVKGDVIAVGQTSIINGTVEGDLMAAGQTVIVNGTVKGAIRMAGSILLLGQNASVGGDIIGAGYSLESKKGSSIGQDLVFAGGQILLAGDVARNVQVATGAFELDGMIGGNVQAEVAESGQGGPPPTMFMPQSPVTAPTVQRGLTIDPSAKIEGDLEYTQTKDLKFPSGVIAGQVTRKAPATNQNAPRQETTGEKISKWGVNWLRTAITLILIGLFLLWLFPFFMQGLSGKLQSAPWRSLGWGAVAYAGFFFIVLVTIAVMIAGGLFFGVLTLGGLAGTIVWLGILSLFALILGFVLVTAFVAKIVFGQALGRWILARTNSPLAEHRFWPMVIGVIITVVVIALLSFPLIPGLLGGLLNFVVILFGLGALWLWGRERRAVRPVG